MKTLHGPILTLLDMIEEAKGPVGKVRLCCIHWTPNAPEHKGAIPGRGVTFADDPNVHEHPAKQLKQSDERPGESLSEGRDGSLKLKERIRFEGLSPVSGYIHLFNLGTSGLCDKLAPSEEFPDNRIEANQVLELPSEQFVRMADCPDGVWEETGPPSSETGHPERILCIVTEDDIELECPDLHPDLEQRHVYTARGPGFGGQVRRNRSKLFNLSQEKWEYGLISLNVL